MRHDPWLTEISPADIEAAMQRKAAREALIAEQAAEITRLRAEIATAIKWRDAINDALTSWHNPVDEEETPREAVDRLIGYETAWKRLSAPRRRGREMSDDLSQELGAFEGSEELANGDFSVCIRGADLIEAQSAEITRLQAELTTARREGMEQAAKRLEELHKNHKYNPVTGEGSEHDTGYYRALAEGAAHILCAAAKEGKP